MSTSSFTLGQAVKRFSATRGKRLPGQIAKLGRRELGKSCREERLEDAGRDKTTRESEGRLVVKMEMGSVDVAYWCWLTSIRRKWGRIGNEDQVQERKWL